MNPRILQRYVLLIALGLFLNTCENIYKPYNDQKSYKFRLEKARIQIDAGNYTEAIELLYPEWVGNKTHEEIAYYYAIAHAGRAGLDAIDLIESLSTALETKSVLEAMSEFFVDADDEDIRDIVEAIRIIEFTSETPTGRSSRMNFLALFANWSRMGIVLNRYAYNDDNELLANTFDACKITSDFDGARTGIPDNAIDELIISVPRILELATLVSGSGDAFDALTGSSFSGLSSASKSAIPCSSNSNNVICLAMRSVINLGSDDGGIGLDTGNFSGSNPGPPVGTCTATYN